MAGLPGTNKVLSIDEFKEHLQQYAQIDAAALNSQFSLFFKSRYTSCSRKPA